MALIFRLGYLWELHRSPIFSLLWGDAQSYDSWARSIAGGDILGTGVFYQAPLYPYFLGMIYTVFGDALIWVRLVQALLGATSCLFLAWTGRIFFSPRVGTLAGVLLAVYPVAIFYDGSIQKSSLDIFFLTLFLLALGKTTVSLERRWWFMSGLTLACLMLTRQNSQILTPIVLLWAWIASRGERSRVLLARLGLFAVGAGLLLIPVGLRNLAVGGEFQITSDFGPNFYIGNNQCADGTYAPLRVGRGEYIYERADAQDLAEADLGRRLSPREVSWYWARRSGEFIRTQPRAWMRLLLRKALLAWNRVEVNDSEDQASYGEWSIIMRWLTVIFHFGILAPAAVFGFVLTWPQRSKIWLLSAVLAGYLVGLLVFYVFSRYRFPMVPMLVLFAAAGMLQALDLLQLRQYRRLTPACIALVIAAAICNWPLLAESETLGRALTQNNIGASMLATPGREREALAYISEALRLVPNFDAAYINRGVAMKRLGQMDEAMRAFNRALMLSPNSLDIHIKLGELLVVQGKLAEALPHFATAADLLPRDPVIRFKYGSLLDDLGQIDEAARQLAESVRLDPNAWGALNNLGMVQFKMGQARMALASFRRALEVNPKSPEVENNLGSVLYFLKQYAEAARSFEGALALKPDYPEALIGLGLVMEASGRTSEAEERYRQALVVRPGDARARSNLSRIMREHSR